MKRLYATLSGVTNEKQVLDQVFGDVLNADDEIGGTTDEYGSPGKWVSDPIYKSLIICNVSFQLKKILKFEKSFKKWKVLIF